MAVKNQVVAAKRLTCLERQRDFQINVAPARASLAGTERRPYDLERKRL